MSTTAHCSYFRYTHPTATAGLRLVRSACLAMLLLCGTVGARMTLLAPRSDEFVPLEDFVVILSVPGDEDKVQKVRLFFDNEEVTASSRRTVATLSFIPAPDFLARPGIEGPHMLTAIIYGPFGKRMEEFSTHLYLVKDTIPTGAQRDAMIEAGRRLSPASPVEPWGSGRIMAWFEYETFQDTGHPVAAIDAWGNGGLSEFKYDYNFTLRTDENRHYQTLQRFRAAAGYGSVARFSAGDNWPSYHQSILSRQRVRGLELNLSTPNKSAGLDVVWGQTLRPTDPFAANPEALAACSTHNDSVSVSAAGTYGRSLLASRLSFGIPRYFSLSATVLKARDDVSSINQLMLIDTISRHSTVTGVTPMDNVAYGLDTQLKLFKGKTLLYGSFAMSWLTKDISNGPIDSTDLARLLGRGVAHPMPDDIAWLLILNQSTLPLPLPVDSTTNVNMKSLAGATDWDAGLRLKIPVGGTLSSADIKYFYAGPSFGSLGNPLLQVDRAGWLINADTRIIGNRLLLKGQFMHYDKDLFEMGGTPTRVLQMSITSFLTLRDDLPTLMLLGSANDERARTSTAADPDRKNGTATFGGSLQYSRQTGAFKPSATLSYYNMATEITSSALSHPFLMRNHTVIAGASALINDVPLEPNLNLSLNASTGDMPLTVGSVAAGTRWRIIPQVFVADFSAGYANTDDHGAGQRNEVTLRGNCRWDISAQQSFWADAALRFTVGKYLDRRVKVNYEFRY